MSEYNPRTRQWDDPSPRGSEERDHPDVLMPFGKHAGLHLSEIERGYLSWLLRETNLDDDLRAAVKAELDRR